MQSRKMSAAETVFATVIGFGVALGANAVILPAFGLPMPMTTNMAVALIYTAVSIVRGYAVRRLFNHIQIRWE